MHLLGLLFVSLIFGCQSMAMELQKGDTKQEHKLQVSKIQDEAGCWYNVIKLNRQQLDIITELDVLFDSQEVAITTVPHLVLDLSSNQLQALPHQLIELKLEGLLLVGNQFDHIPDVVRQLTSLRILTFDNNILTSLPTWIDELVNLEILYLAYNRITELPEIIKGLQKLKKLDLSYNRIQAIDQLLSLKKLEHLALISNEISQVPAEIQQLVHLVRLNLRSNRIARLPEDFYQLRSLKILDLGDNLLHSLSPEIGLFGSLQELSLQKNNIVLPDYLEKDAQGCALPALENLFLDHCDIEQLPKWVYELKALKALRASFNYLTELQNISRLTKLRGLWLNNNKLTTLPPLPESLETLELRGNRVRQIPEKFQSQHAQQGNLKKAPFDISFSSELKSYKAVPIQVSSIFDPSIQQLCNQVIFRGFELTDVTGIAEFEVLFEGKKMPLQDVPNLSLFLHDNNLVDLPAELATLQLRVLMLSNNQFEKIPAVCFELKNLLALNVSNNKLMHVDKKIESLQQLEYLNVDDNQLSKIPASIGTLQKLKILMLANNLLTELPRELAGLSSLETFSVSGNRLQTLPENMSALEKLTYLSAGDNNFTVFPGCLCSLKKLSTLSFRNNFLTELPEQLGQLTELNALHLQGNQLTDIGSGILILKNLGHLRLAGNRISKVPQELQNLDRLQTLDLSNNNLSEFPQVILSMNLLQLFLGQNSIKQIPAEIHKLTNLRLLYLDDAGLSALPSSMSSMGSLIELHVAGNQLSSIPEGLTQLQLINVSGNKLKTFPEGLASTSSLKYLNVSDNHLGDNGIALLFRMMNKGQLMQLHTLCLDGNGLTQLPSAIALLTNLRRLSCARNNLTMLPPLKTLERLERLDASHNKLTNVGNFLSGNLRELYLSHNNLRYMPAVPLQFLEVLCVNDNQLQEIESWIGSFRSLKRLELAGNNLTSLPENFGAAVISQDDLLARLSAIPLPYINGFIFQLIKRGQLSKLEYLDISNNNLDSLPSSMGALDNLKTLKIFGNAKLAPKVRNGYSRGTRGITVNGIIYKDDTLSIVDQEKIAVLLDRLFLANQTDSTHEVGLHYFDLITEIKRAIMMINSQEQLRVMISPIRGLAQFDAIMPSVYAYVAAKNSKSIY